jgi:acyl-CoA thioesterase I
MRTLVLIICYSVLLFIVGTLGVRWWQQPLVTPIAADAPIVFFGDSLVSGVGATEGNDMPALLSVRLGRTVLNKGVPGDTTRDGLNRLNRDVLSLHPDLVILLLGGNDFLQNIDADETFANLAEMIDRIRKQESQVLLVGVRGGIFLDGFDTAFAALARKKRIHHVPDILDGVLMDPALKADQIHPNNAGYVKMVEKLEPIIRLYLTSTADQLL